MLGRQGKWLKVETNNNKGWLFGGLTGLPGETLSIVEGLAIPDKLPSNLITSTGSDEIRHKGFPRTFKAGCGSEDCHPWGGPVFSPDGSFTRMFNNHDGIQGTWSVLNNNSILAKGRGGTDDCDLGCRYGNEHDSKALSECISECLSSGLARFGKKDPTSYVALYIIFGDNEGRTYMASSMGDPAAILGKEQYHCSSSNISLVNLYPYTEWKN